MLYSKLVLALASVALGSTIVTTASAGTACSKYLVESGGDLLTFNNYLFQDFTDVSGTAAAPSISGADNGEPISAYEADLPLGPTTEMKSFFQNEDISRNWIVSSWSRMTSPVPMENEPANVFIDYDPTSPDDENTMLSIITARGSNGIQTAGELQSVFNIDYGSVRFQARVTGDSGACAGMFFYRDDSHESDIEFLTRDGPDYVHMTNQPGNENGAPVPGATTNLSLIYPYNYWTNYRIDWYPGMTRYFVNEELVANKTVNVSPLPMYWMMNLWSDGTSWPGVMAVGNSARLDIRWVQIVYNNTNTLSADGDVVCVVQ